jgi:hypothetical protein
VRPDEAAGWGELRAALNREPSPEGWRAVLDWATLLGPGAQEYAKGHLLHSEAWAPPARRPVLDFDHLKSAVRGDWCAPLFGSVMLGPDWREIVAGAEQPGQAERLLAALHENRADLLWLSNPAIRHSNPPSGLLPRRFRMTLGWSPLPFNDYPPPITKDIKDAPGNARLSYREVVLDLDRLYDWHVRAPRTPRATALSLLLHHHEALRKLLPKHLREGGCLMDGGSLRNTIINWGDGSWRDQLLSLANRMGGKLKHSVANHDVIGGGADRSFPAERGFRPTLWDPCLTRLIFTTSREALFPSLTSLVEQINLPAELSGPCVMERGGEAVFHYLRAEAVMLTEPNPLGGISWELPGFSAAAPETLTQILQTYDPAELGLHHNPAWDPRLDHVGRDGIWLWCGRM